jgi:hypothetical protein
MLRFELLGQAGDPICFAVGGRVIESFLLLHQLACPSSLRTNSGKILNIWAFFIFAIWSLTVTRNFSMMIYVFRKDFAGAQNP